MKRCILLLIIIVLAKFAFSQTLFTYGSHSVSKQEFLSSYRKNINVADQNVKTSIADYLRLYIDYKLKIQDARDQKLDTLSSQIKDLENYKEHLIPGFLYDETILNNLTREAIERSLHKIHVEYIFIPLVVSEDSTTSLIKAKNIFDKVRKNISFHSQPDVIKDNKISFYDAGFVTVFSLPYEFENIIFSLNPISSSGIVKGKNGYYIFQVTEKITSKIYSVNAAQILLALPPDPSIEEDKEVKNKADSIHLILINGGDFSNLAKQFSNDRMTAENGGILEEIGLGKYEFDFEKNILNLKKEGDITPPFKTSFGYHIVKLLHQNYVNEDKNDQANFDFWKQKVIDDKRVILAKEALLLKVKKDFHFKLNNKINQSELIRITDSFITKGKKIYSTILPHNTLLFSLNNKHYTLLEWNTFLTSYRTTIIDSVFNNTPAVYTKAFNNLMNIFINNMLLNYYKEHLPENNPKFKALLKEFIDGNLIYEIMNEKIWSKTHSDTLEILNYFNENKSKYDQKTFDEVKGSVINDYQKNLEEKWMAELKKKYPVTIITGTLNSIGNQ